MQDEGFALYRRFLDGDEEGLEELIALYRRGLFRFIYGYVQDEGLAEDVVQEVFVRLYYKRSFKEREGASFKTYVYKIARNLSLNAIKKRKRKKELSLEGLLEKSAGPTAREASESALGYLYGDGADEQMEKRESAKALHAAIGRLNENYREVLILRYFDNLPPERIAAITRRNVKQVYNLLARGRVALKEELSAEEYWNEDE